MTWTFSESFKQSTIEAVLELLAGWEDDDDVPDGGFIDGVTIGIHLSDTEGGDHYLGRFAGDMRMLAGLGLIEANKFQYLASFGEDSPLVSGFRPSDE